MSAYLTKVALGRWWVYLDTRRKYKTRMVKILHWYFVIVSYRKSSVK